MQDLVGQWPMTKPWSPCTGTVSTQRWDRRRETRGKHAHGFPGLPCWQGRAALGVGGSLTPICSLEGASCPLSSTASSEVGICSSTTGDIRGYLGLEQLSLLNLVDVGLLASCPLLVTVTPSVLPRHTCQALSAGWWLPCGSLVDTLGG